MKRIETLKWIAGPLAAALIWLLPLEFSPEEHRLAGVVAWVVLWWVFEPIPLAATGLFGVSLSVVLGVSEAKPALAPFAHPLIFLFFGGFLIARSMSVHALDRRIALFLLTRRGVSGRPWRIIVALLLVTAFLSMWISNTATTAMLLPIGMGVLATVFPDSEKDRGTVLLAVAYASSIGGVATPVGSTPNIIVLGMLERLAGIRITFLEWMGFALPAVTACLLFLIFITRRRIPALPDRQDTGFLDREYEALGPLRRGERNTFLAAGTAVFLWIAPSLVSLILGKDHEVSVWLDARFPEAVGALLAATLLFVLRSEEKPTLPWSEAVRIDWGSLLLFGGGLSLGVMMFDTGLAARLGEAIVTATQGTDGGWAIWVFTVLAVFFAIFFTETTSNTATANMLIPLIIAAAQRTGFDPLMPAIAVAMACSFAFMMPVSTPPNAIVYGSGYIRIPDMIRNGFILNIACGLIVLLTAGFLTFSV